MQGSSNIERIRKQDKQEKQAPRYGDKREAQAQRKAQRNAKEAARFFN